GLPGEATGRILTPDEWSPSASGSVPIGMSVDATLVQMAAAYATIANDGTYIQPHLIKEMISGRDGKVSPAAPPEPHPVLRGDVAAPAFSQMMQYTLLHYGVPPSTTKPPTFKIYP